MSKNVYLIVGIVLAAMAVALVFSFSGAGSGRQSSISYIGSSTIGENIIPAAFELFSEKSGVKVGAIESPGSGKGVEAVIEGKSPLAGASRPLEAKEEKENLYKQIIGYDAIVVFVHNDNPVSNLTKEEIKAIFSGRIRNWREVGGHDAPITVITEMLGEKRATMMEFQKLAMDGVDYLGDRKEVDKPDDQVAALKQDKNGIISVSRAFADPATKALSINGIDPNEDNVRSGVYLLSRPLILVAKGQPENEIAEFFTFMLSSQGQAVVNKKFVGL